MTLAEWCFKHLDAASGYEDTKTPRGRGTNSHITMAKSKIESTMDSNAIGVVVQCPCSALVELAANALNLPIAQGGVISVDGQTLNFEQGRALAKAKGFRSYIDLLFWLAEKHTLPFKGTVVWPNAGHLAQKPAPQDSDS